MGLFDSVSDMFGERTPKEDPQVALRLEAAKHTVLVIDDDKDYLETCTQILRDAGYNVLRCNNGPKGLNMLRYAPKDISAVLLDYDMPQFDGVDTVNFVRKIAPQVRVGAVSGVDEAILPASFREAVDQFLAKPFEGERLLEFVRALIAAPVREIPTAGAENPPAPTPAAAH